LNNGEIIDFYNFLTKNFGQIVDLNLETFTLGQIIITFSSEKAVKEISKNSIKSIRVSLLSNISK